ncbi:MAG: hypothetical protein IKK82_13550 [Kiritimatiellae bacterium]|nr:hypothetical protein [Kiritimatiellia bacterium]
MESENTTPLRLIGAWLKELEAIHALLIPTEPHPGIVLEPDFRKLVIPSPSSLIIEAAIDSISDYAINQELSERARRLENDMTDFDCTKRRFREECADMRIAQKRQADGTLSNTPEALKRLRRNLKNDIARLKEIIGGANGNTVSQTPSAPVMVELVPKQAALLEQAVDNSQGAKQAAEQAADNSQAVIDEMAEWRKWLVTLNKPGKHRVVPKLSAPMQQAVINCWSKYKEECENKKERSTFQGCLDNHGVDVIYTNTLTRKSYQLIELAQDEGTLQRIIHNHNSKESARTKSSLPKNDIDTPDILHTPDILQHITLYPEKSKSRQKRKRK